MIIQAELKCKQTGCEADPCAVDKVIELPSPRFRQFSRALLADYDFIAENKNAVRHDEAMLLTYAAMLEAERPETLHRACELLQDLDNYQRITEDPARCIRDCQHTRRKLEGKNLNAQKERDGLPLAS